MPNNLTGLSEQQFVIPVLYNTVNIFKLNVTHMISLLSDMQIDIAVWTLKNDRIIATIRKEWSSGMSAGYKPVYYRVDTDFFHLNTVSTECLPA